MISTKLYRLSGIALLIGGLLVVIGIVPEFFIDDEVTNSTISVIALLRLFGSVLISAGLPGMYLRQAAKVGNWGLFGFVTVLFYILMEGVAGDTVNAFIVPYVSSKAPELLNDNITSLDIYNSIGGLLGVVGGLSLGIASWRAAILSRGASLALIIGMALFLIGNFLLPLLASIGVLLIMGALAWFGQSLLSSLRESQPDLSLDKIRA